MRSATFLSGRHREERSDEAIQGPQGGSALLRFARNDGRRGETPRYPASGRTICSFSTCSVPASISCSSTS